MLPLFSSLNSLLRVLRQQPRQILAAIGPNDDNAEDLRESLRPMMALQMSVRNGLKEFQIPLPTANLGNRMGDAVKTNEERTQLQH